ncbi:MAG: efflux RND transporter periplasmic adaptor subunit [Candidatus Xenobiia bacterium LiM19]
MWLSRCKKVFITVGSIAVVAVIVIWILQGTMSHRKGHGGDIEPVDVKVMTVEPQEIPDQVWASGSVCPIQRARLSPKIVSTVMEVCVREGEYVKEGQVLVRLEAHDLLAQRDSASAQVTSSHSLYNKTLDAIELQKAQSRASVVSAETSLSVARQQLSMLQEGPRKEEKSQAHLSFRQAEAQYRVAESELSRMTSLYEQGVIPTQRMETVQAQYETAKSQYGIAENAVKMADTGGRSQEIKSAQDRVRQAEEALKLARVAVVQNTMAENEAQAQGARLQQAQAGERFAQAQADYATITAPFNGFVTGRFVDSGDLVSPGIPLVSVEDNSQFRLEAQVAARDIRKVRKGMKVPLEIGAKGTKGTGTVAVVSPGGDVSTRKFLVKVNIPSSMNPISGDFGRAAFTVGHSQGIVVPESSVHDEGGILNVFLMGADNRSDMRIVRTGRTFMDKVEITTGISPGDRVVLWSGAPLYDDIPLRIKED